MFGFTLAKSNVRFIFENKYFGRLFYSSFISQIGTNVNRIALVYLIYSVTQEVFWVSAVIASQALATIVVAPALSAWAEQQSPRRLLIITDLVRAPLVLLIPFFVTRSLEATLGLIFVLAIIHNLHDPVLNAVVPQVVVESKIDTANGLLLFADSFGEIAFAALAGILIAAFGPQLPFVIDAMSFVVSGVILLGLPHLAHASASSTAYWSQVKAGIKEVFFNQGNRSLVSTLFTAAMFGTMTNVVAIVLAVSILNVGSPGFGAMEGLMAFGTILGTLAIPQLITRTSRERVFLLSLVGFGLFQASIGFLPSFTWVLFAFFASGLLNMGFLIPARSALQLNTAPELRTRVFIAFGALMRTAVLIGTLASGILAGYLKVPMIFIMSGLMVTAVALWSFLQYRRLNADAVAK